MKKRKIDLVVISDVHLGTYGCHADELIAYLNSIQSKKLILNGDIIDIWQFSKRFSTFTYESPSENYWNGLQRSRSILYYLKS